MSTAVVLMYHRIGRGALPGREAGEEIYAVAPEAFEAQLEVLASAKAKVAPMNALLGGGGAGALPTRAVALTFDDGNATDHSEALPALVRRGYDAAFFITPAWVGTKGYMDWNEVRELEKAGMTVGAHGLDHTLLSTLPEDALRPHLREARRHMEARLGRAPETLSLPGGAGGAKAVSAARAEGFRFVFDSTPRRLAVGGWSPGSALPRFAVRGGDEISVFRELVEHRPAALARAWARYGALSSLRALVGPDLYRRVRNLGTRSSSTS
jgi:peptidoglycan/xylan/chitin deacetylase (PgdA/CDA1 family)